MSLRAGVLMTIRAVANLVLSLVLVAGCVQVDPRSRLYPTGAERYRLLRDGDFCSELALFARPEPASMIGTVLDGASSYTDPRTGSRFRAVSVFTVVKGKRVDRWYRRDALVDNIYVFADDPRLKRCSYWLEREEVIWPLPTERPAE
jgi:hypothetical protein